MMCAAMEPSSSFSTTYGFATASTHSTTATRGFDTLAQSCAAAAYARSALSASPSIHGGQLTEARLAAAKAALAAPPAALPAVLAPTPSSVDAHYQQQQQQQQDSRSVGWSGLLEISRMSGAPGIVGLPSTSQSSQQAQSSQIEVCATAHTNQAIRRLVKAVLGGLKSCQEPEKALDGMGGTYFFCNENGQKVAILKPCDEEPLAPNNPKGYVGRALGDPGWKPTVRVGEAAMREVAAYLLDGGFARVPTSVLVRARHPIFCYNSSIASVRASTTDLVSLGGQLPMKLGSLQEFVPHQCDTTEMGSSRFLTRDVHRIGILDIRLFNTDRHAGNMLVRSSRESSGNLLAGVQYELIPIDHGFCLPETLEAPYFEWLHWPQAMLPFGPEELQYIKDLDIEADKELLSKELPNLRPECIRVLELTTALLQRCAEAGMTLYEIGTVLSRPFVNADEDPSELEKICSKAKAKRCFEMQEIAEEDECSSECDDEGDGDTCGMLQCMDEDEELEMEEQGHAVPGSHAGSFKSAAHAMVGSMGEGKGLHVRSGGVVSGPCVGGGHRQLLGCNSNSTEEESMMFDLEEDAAGNRAVFVKTASAVTFEPISPSQCSVGSEYWPGDASSNAAQEVPGMTMVGRGGLGAALRQGGVHAAADVAAGDAAKNLARSIHVPTSFMWQMSSRRRQGTKRMSKCTKPNSPQAYPPPVMAMQGAASISFSDFDEHSWRLFKHEVLNMVDDAIISGQWRQATRDAPGGVATSYPF